MLLRSYYVYMLAQEPHGVIYVGVTNDLVRRTWEHKQGQNTGFTKKYHVKMLVWYEHYHDITMAIQREKQLKKWKRQWKVDLIEKDNADWVDLYGRLR